MLKFRLSDETRVILNRDKSVSKLSKKQINYYNSPEFYAAASTPNAFISATVFSAASELPA